MSPEATNALIAFEPVSPRLIAARFNAKGRKTTLIQCYAPTNAATDEEKENFYSALQAQIDKSPKRNIKIVMYEALSSLAEETIEQKWLGKQELWKSSGTDMLGKRKNEQKEWITAETWAKIEDRKEIKQKMNKCKDEKEKINLRTHYCQVNRMVRKSAKEDKRQFIQEMIAEAETAARQGKMKRLYEVTRTLSGKNINPNKPVKDKVGNILTIDTEQRDRWVQHFDEILNHPLSSNIPDIPPSNHLLNVCTDPPTKLETIRAIKNMKNGKAAGPDGIPPEALKADPAISADILHPLLKQIWEEDIIPSDWKLGYLIKLPKKGDLT
ncbi:uncharacterized protein LOC131955489 [Physella acuta]|uniref:uncharacterized protein LOC131955489 n=1 Tax=Physella acuta TaxID=109671 RepID=UPI0027DD5D9E|nr:uncharacterized protein LOC131955489 [Physella acuta]